MWAKICVIRLNKQVNLQNKILITNENKDSTDSLSHGTPTFKYKGINLKKESEAGLQEGENKSENISDRNKERKGSFSGNRPKLDLNVVNDSETCKIFASSYVNSYNTLNNANKAQTNGDDGKENLPLIGDNNLPSAVVNGVGDRDKDNNTNTYSDKSSPSMNKYTLNKNVKMSLNISPKSAFVKMK